MEASASPFPRARAALRLPLGPAAGDDRLVARVRAGDQDAFEHIVDRYERPLLSFCRHMLGRPHDAEEAVQQAFVSAYQSLLRHPERDINLRPWLFTIARNHSLSMLRARRDHADIADVEPATSGLDATAEQREDLRDLLADLAELPDDQRAALLLLEIGALQRDEIATVIGCDPKKVKALVFQARSHLWNSRTARETSCAEIREQLATLTGGALRRAPLRRHLRDCPGCRAFEAETKRQHAALAIVLPVAPGLALKHSIMSAISAGGGGATAAAVGGTAGGGLAAAGTVKTALTVLGVTAAAAGGGVAVERSLPSTHPVTPHLAPASPAAKQRAFTSVSAAAVATPAATSAGPGTAAAPTSRAHGSATSGHHAKHGRSADAPGASVAAEHRSDRATEVSKGANGAAHRANPPRAAKHTPTATAKSRRRVPPKAVVPKRPANAGATSNAGGAPASAERHTPPTSRRPTLTTTPVP